MNQKRILAYKMAQQLSEEDIDILSAAKGPTSKWHRTSGLPTFDGCRSLRPCDSRTENDQYSD